MSYLLISAKDLASRRNTLKRPIKKQNTVDKSSDPFESMERSLTPTTAAKFGDRHWTISGLRTRFSSFKKSHSSEQDITEDPGYIRRKDRSITASVFYDDENMSVTKCVSEPGNFDPLDLKGKAMNEILSLLIPVSFYFSHLSP